MTNYKAICKLYKQYKKEVSDLYKRVGISDEKLTHDEHSVLIRHMASEIRRLQALDY